MADTPTGETVVTDASKTEVTPVVTPAPAVPAPVVNDAASEVAQLRKEKEQAEMRANQLANQLKTKTDAEAAAEAARLVENEEYKTLFEQEKAKREALETESTAKQRDAELATAKQTALDGFSEEVKTLADDLGFNLDAADEASVEAFKGKLTKLSERVSGEARVTPNNPGPQKPQTEFTSEQLRENLGDEQKFHDLVTKRFPGIAAMTKPQS